MDYRGGTILEAELSENLYGAEKTIAKEVLPSCWRRFSSGPNSRTIAEPDCIEINRAGGRRAHPQERRGALANSDR